MQETLGGQLSGLSEMLRASTQSMGEVESTLRSLVADMQRTSSESTAGMQQAVHSLIERLQAEQQRQAQQSAAGMNDLLGKVGAAVEQIARQQESLREQSQQDLSRLTEAMQTRVDLLADSNRQAQEQGISLARTMSEVSTRAIAGMEAGANAVAEALQGVQQATARLEALTGQMTSLQGAFGDSARRLSDSSATVGGATQSLTAVVGSLGSTAQRLERLGTTIESEAAARNGMLEDIRALSSQARNTGQSLAQLTEEVHEKLAGSIAAFGDAVTKTLDQNLHAYNKQLSDAVHTLSEAFNDLAETLDVQTVRG
jgi:methyl-accepting chemotaxis protein